MSSYRYNKFCRLCTFCKRQALRYTPSVPEQPGVEAGPHPFASLSQADACRIAAVGIALRLLASLQSLRCPLASEALPRMATLVASTHMTKINRKAFPWLSISVQGRVAAQECEIPQRRSSTAGALADAGVEGRQGRFVSETGREEVCEALHHGPPGELRLGRLLRGRHCVSEAGTCGCLKYGRGTRVPPCMYHLPGRPFSQGPTMRDSPPPLVRKTWQAEEAPSTRVPPCMPWPSLPGRPSRKVLQYCTLSLVAPSRKVLQTRTPLPPLWVRNLLAGGPKRSQMEGSPVVIIVVKNASDVRGRCSARGQRFAQIGISAPTLNKLHPNKRHAMPSTTVPTAVYPTSRASFERAASSGSSRSSLEVGAELGLQSRRVFYGTSSPEAESTRIQHAAGCQVEARRTMMKRFANFFTPSF
jgi:hypothetical protein